jgi:hypothetical protein
LGFSTTKYIDAVKYLSDFKSTLKNTVTWSIRKGKQTVIFIFSKEVLIAVFIFFNSNYIEPNVDWSSFSSSQVYQSRVIKSDTSGFVTSPSHIQDYILKSRGGCDFTDEQQEKLAKSILARTPESDIDDININKLLQRLLEIIDPVISDKRLWKILSELEKPLKPRLSDGNPISSTEILDTTQNSKSKSSSIFANALVSPSTQIRKTPTIKKSWLDMTQTSNENSFSNELTPSGLSQNHEELSKNTQSIEKLTKLRRAQPLYPSQVLGDSYEYGGKQLERKSFIPIYQAF